MPDSEINEKTRNADLRDHLVAFFVQHRAHGALKIIRGLVSRLDRALHDTGLRERQVLFQNSYSARTAIARINFVRL